MFYTSPQSFALKILNLKNTTFLSPKYVTFILYIYFNKFLYCGLYTIGFRVVAWYVARQLVCAKSHKWGIYTHIYIYTQKGR